MSSALFLQAAAVGVGGFLGALCRYGLVGLMAVVAPTASIPLGTLVVNLIGCLGIGVLSKLVETQLVLPPETRAFLFVGFLGSLTTYSTFAFESEVLFREGQGLRAAAYILLHLILGLGLVILGRYLVK